MTRKDYELIARVLQYNKATLPAGRGAAFFVQDGCYSKWLTICEDFAEVLEDQNPRFDRERFLKACGVAG